MFEILDEVETLDGNFGGVVYQVSENQVSVIDESGVKLTTSADHLRKGKRWMKIQERRELLSDYGLLPNAMKRFINPKRYE